MMRGQYDAALRQLEGAKTSGAAPAEIENLRGLALMMKGELAKSLAAFDRALELQPALVEAKFNRALALLRRGDAANASAEFEAVFANPSFGLRADAAYHNAVALDRLGRAADAEQWLGRARALDPTLDAALLYLGFLKERRGDVQGAGRAYLDYLKAHPRSVSAMLHFAIAAQRAGRAEVAKPYLQRVIETAPSSPEAIEARKFLVMWE